MVSTASDLRIKLFADTGDLGDIELWAPDPRIRGFTTNPSLVRRAGIRDYASFCLQVMTHANNKPVSFEVFADDPDEMLHQAHTLHSWNPNIWVKIPVTNTKGEFMGEVIKTLSMAGVPINVTAVFTLEQVEKIAAALSVPGPGEKLPIVSIFAGRIADTGVDPRPLIGLAKKMVGYQAAILWASCREVYNIIEAQDAGADIITVSPDILAKLPLLGKSLEEYSLETVQQFHRDAEGLTL